MAGYSQTPLAKKLGIKAEHKMLLVDPPDYYWQLFADLPEDITITEGKGLKDFIHIFAGSRARLEKAIPALKKQLVPNGMIWVSWPKKAAKVPTDVTEDVIRNIALANGLVDIKVCAIDETWSGLKLVIPVAER